MNSFRTLLVVAVLGVVGYGAYYFINRSPDPGPPPGVAEGWDAAPTIEMPGPASASGTPAPMAIGPNAALTPNIVPGAPAGSPAPVGSPVGEAPPFVAQAETPSGTGAPPFVSPGLGPAPTETPIAPPRAGTTDPKSPPSGALPVVTADPATPSYPKAPAAATPGDNTSAASPKPGAGGDPQFMADMKAIETQLDQMRLADAHLALSAWYGDPRLSEAEQQRVTDLLDQLAGTVIYSQEHLLEPAYVVRQGDTLEAIGKFYCVPPELLAKINGISTPGGLRPGQELKVVRGPFHAVVDLERRQLTLTLQGRYAGRFPIGLGRDRNTPAKEFVVKKKVPNPTYYGPDRIIPPGDPSNPLGGRLIELEDQIGIHGTNDPAGVAKGEAKGSIALAPRDINDVYDILSEGSKVIVRR
ncbi:MAG: L,D-transpeptidase family protein [Pirellulales bacterium]